MADNNNGLPEGTDTIIEGGGAGGSEGGSGRSGTTNQGGSPSTATNSTGARTSMTADDSQTDSLITSTTGATGATGITDTTASTGSDGSNSLSTGSETSGSASSGGIRGMVSNVSTKARGEVANRARGFVGDGLKSGSDTLNNISTLIGDTVEQIEQKLGPQYAGYARTASQTIDRYAQSIANKDPDELVDDARELVRRSPGVALAGAAILGFGLVRLLKAGMPDDADAEQRAARRRSDS